MEGLGVLSSNADSGPPARNRIKRCSEQKFGPASHTSPTGLYNSLLYVHLQVARPFVLDSIANMSTARDIPVRSNGTDRKRTVSNSFDMNQSISFHSTSPVAVMSPPSSHGRQARSGAGAGAKSLKPFNTQDIKVLLLENVNKIGQDMLKGQGYQVEALKSSLPEDQLIEKIKCVVTTTHGRFHADACV